MTCGKFEQEWFRTHTPNGRMEILDNCAHLTWFEYPEKYTDLVISFVLGLGL